MAVDIAKSDEPQIVDPKDWEFHDEKGALIDQTWFENQMKILNTTKTRICDIEDAYKNIRKVKP